MADQRGSSSFTVLTDGSDCLLAADSGSGGAGLLHQPNANEAPRSGAMTVTSLALFGAAQSEPESTLDRSMNSYHASAATVAPTGAAVDIQFAGAVMTVTQGNMVLDQYSATIGRVGPDVRSVVVRRADGVDVTASVQNGWFVVWWSGDSRSHRLTIDQTDGSFYEQEVPTY